MVPERFFVVSYWVDAASVISYASSTQNSMTPKREFSPGITSRRPPPALHILNHCLLSTTCRELLKITQNLRNFPNCGLSSINLKCGRDTLRGRRMYPLPFLVGLVPSPVQMKRIAITNLEVQGKSGKQPARFGYVRCF